MSAKGSSLILGEEYIEPQYSIYRYLDTNGDGTGTKSAIGNYASPTDFYFEAQRVTELHRILISVEDTQGMQAEEYGNLGAALSNGYVIEAKDASDNVLQDYCDGVAVTTNANLGRICYDLDLKSWGAGNELLLARFTFTRSGNPVILSAGQKLVVTLNDDFTGLLSHYFMLQGFENVDR